MSDHDNYNVSHENQEDIRKLVCELYAATGRGQPSEEEIGETCAKWAHWRAIDNISALEFGKEQIAFYELEKKIGAESETCDERRQRLENELGMSTEDEGTFDIALDDIEWMEAKTGCKIEEIHRLSSAHGKLIGIVYQNPDDEKMKKALEHFEDKLESALSETKKYLQSVLALQQKQRAKSPMDVPVKQTRPCARTASRARRGTQRPTFAQKGGGGSGDDGDGDPDQGDPPGPSHNVTPFPNCPEKLNSSPPPWRRPGSWLMAEGGRAA
jgi:hypothetical protein